MAKKTKARAGKVAMPKAMPKMRHMPKGETPRSMPMKGMGKMR